ncbi:hypothetical protein [Flavobacterium orientale]|jgi:hypothetical protein|uniref:Uncharacterized protein n=1 Tax=Flavobacterium orientale TaxID=1756020 RepID=A0A916XYV0_9FLAO|nr:hypothetical protein [Flavobacterium orientale]GGD22535.1 hypothetical protein GCM10011343_10920 [Flavobacterium orientale]
MNNLEKLSDNQLINLFNGGNIDTDLKNKLINEIDRRDLEKIKNKKESISKFQKVFVFFTSIFLFKYHIKIANGFLMNGNKKLYNEYWRWYSFGVGFKFILLLLIAKYLLKPKILMF